MEDFRERELRQGLGHFQRVWSRVQAAQSSKAAAERCGVKLMPKQMRSAGCQTCPGRRRSGEK